MSTLIPTLKAYGIVKECCEQVMPYREAIASIRALIQQIATELSKEDYRTAPQAGPTISPGPVIRTAVQVLRGRPGEVVPLVPGRAPKTASSPELSRELRTFIETISGLIDKLEALNPCSALLGCVAEGFRKTQLDQGEEHKRRKLLDKSFVVHYVNKPNWPKKVQHSSRK